jgi:hypothetical protein
MMFYRRTPPLKNKNFISYCRMSNSRLVFEIRYGGRFNRTLGCEYVSGDVPVYTKSVHPDKLSYFELKGICRPYGYNSGDLIYFQEPGKSLVNVCI